LNLSNRIILTIMNQKTFSILIFLVTIIKTEICSIAQPADSIVNKTILFFDNFAKDPIGRFPTKWISNRPGEVVTLKNLPGKWFKMHSEGTYLPKLNQDLSTTFTVEFDFIYQTTSNGNNITEFTLFTKPANAENDALFPGSSGIKIVFETFIVSCLCYDNLNPNRKVSSENRGKLIQANNIAKITIRVNQQQLHILVNGFECLSVPNCNESNEAFNAVRFHLWGSEVEPLVGNFRIVKN